MKRSERTRVVKGYQAVWFEKDDKGVKRRRVSRRFTAASAARGFAALVAKQIPDSQAHTRECGGYDDLSPTSQEPR